MRVSMMTVALVHLFDSCILFKEKNKNGKKRKICVRIGVIGLGEVVAVAFAVDAKLLCTKNSLNSRIMCNFASHFIGGIAACGDHLYAN